MTDTLYQWPSSKYEDSIYPRCVVIKRLYNLANAKLEVVNVGIKSNAEDLKFKLSQVPQLKNEFGMEKNTPDIINYIHSSHRSLNNVYSYNTDLCMIIRQWANEVFLNSLLYARWVKEENFIAFVQTINWGIPLNEVLKELSFIRKNVIAYVNSSNIGSLHEIDFQEVLKKQLTSLDKILNGQPYIGGLTNLTLTDLYCFMVIQGLKSPALEESRLFEDGFDNINSWYKKIDEETSRK